MRLLAPAKVNLALHVTGRRADGYHLLDSIVVFADHGDTITLAPSADLSLTVTGPRASGVPTDRRNLIWQAAEAFPPGQGAAITLDKHLPHAGGIGGGSSDAATALRGLSDFWGLPMPDAAAILSLGADVPVCVFGRPARMAGIGEDITPLPDLPPLWIVLVNPGVEVPTGAVFKALDRADNPPLPDLPPSGWPDAPALIDWLCQTRNDLEPPARTQAPEIGQALDRLNARPGCLMARMSGSGATCFALFSEEFPARDAAAALAADQPEWWCVAAPVLGLS
ncbi:4-(cytidine 5'-diphospho)-2-C-methyl-D-erythritol kinase [Roseicyclus marinus]|uniref:4-(cytidine 5'-diphospho)-2-C-methyl-D-erythritol kinase n=1 Tax=Roseicyclus marinus TaxID=2161673 RepID=UPI00240F6B21|nr:4-(cytidine 5'-diphospho)-2-C-methyl-D-erythritol kinase [Roseicyclus marinus]MDG3042606.1 4-(cytidine 5'-diphospho)-2-C-methyl-D-erythritol kinase [Roseicyclus marinus]